MSFVTAKSKTSNVVSSITRNVYFTRIGTGPQAPPSASSPSSADREDRVAPAMIYQNPFPQTLMEILSEEDPAIITWLPSGKAFIVRSSRKFVDSVLPKYFRQTKMTSFQRQLNLYGFRRIVEGPDTGAYQHDLFSRDEPELCRSIRRNKRKRAKSVESSCSGGQSPRSTAVEITDSAASSPSNTPVVTPRPSGDSVEPTGLTLRPWVATSSCDTTQIISRSQSPTDFLVVPLPDGAAPVQTGLSILMSDSFNGSPASDFRDSHLTNFDNQAFALAHGTIQAVLPKQGFTRK